MGEPYPKTKQLARGERRYRRTVASPKQWQAIIAAKRGPCRVCGWTHKMGHTHHHIVPRDRFGDDVADNIVPVGWACHDLIELRNPQALARLAESLTDAERAYVAGKIGADGLRRLFDAGVS